MKFESFPRMYRPIICVVGARPNYMKMAPIWRAFGERQPSLAKLLVHTGQHYDVEMNEKFFFDLDLPVPDINLEVGSGSHAVQTSDVMRKFEPVLEKYNPSCIVVVGDVNSTLACSLVAAKKNIAVMHVEAGLRSHDRNMPEEINRVLTDQLASRLYITERSALLNLIREGIDQDRVCFSGNVMIDSVSACKSRAVAVEQTLKANGYGSEFIKERDEYALVTLHRPSNVDNKNDLQNLIQILVKISDRLPLVFAVHPRTKANIAQFNLYPLVQKKEIALVPPLGYLEMLGIMAGAKMVLTDSGGIQEETTALGVPCLTLRKNTERPITVDQGTNTLVGTEATHIFREVETILQGNGKKGRLPERWDGQAAIRIVDDVCSWLANEENFKSSI